MEGGKKEDGNEGSFLSCGQLVKLLVVGVCKGVKYVEEKCLLSILLAADCPVPPPLGCVISSLSQALARASRESGR